jgi:hypothetical protein
VRKVLIALLGALVLQLGLVQTALADDPTGSSATTTTTAGQTTTTAGQTTTTAGQTTTTAGQTTTTAGETTTTTEPEAGPLTGVFDRQPASGPVGTVIAVRSVTPCVPPKDAANPEVEVVLFNEHSLQQGELTIDEVFPLRADGTWSGEVIVPADAELGEYIIDAACFAAASPTEEPFLIYQPQGFTVVAAAVTPPAPPAAAVVREPNLTG